MSIFTGKRLKEEVLLPKIDEILLKTLPLSHLIVGKNLKNRFIFILIRSKRFLKEWKCLIRLRKQVLMTEQVF